MYVVTVMLGVGTAAQAADFGEVAIDVPSVARPEEQLAWTSVEVKVPSRKRGVAVPPVRMETATRRKQRAAGGDES